MALTNDQLETLKKKLLEERQKLENVLVSLEEQSVVGDTDRVNDNADQGTDALEEENLIRNESLVAKTEVMLSRIRQALARIDAGTYGKTEDGTDIPYERLLIDPTATTTVS